MYRFDIQYTLMGPETVSSGESSIHEQDFLHRPVSDITIQTFSPNISDITILFKRPSLAYFKN